LSPWVPLMHSTSLVARARYPISGLVHTEVAIISGFGLSLFSSARHLISTGVQAFRVSFVFLGLLFLLF